MEWLCALSIRPCVLERFCAFLTPYLYPEPYGAAFPLFGIFLFSFAAAAVDE